MKSFVSYLNFREQSANHLTAVFFGHSVTLDSNLNIAKLDCVILVATKKYNRVQSKLELGTSANQKSAEWLTNSFEFIRYCQHAWLICVLGRFKLLNNKYEQLYILVFEIQKQKFLNAHLFWKI